MKFLIAFLFLFISVISFSQFKNIKIAEQADGLYPPVEPSIAINKSNPKNIVAGIVLNRVATSQDGGATWNTTELKSPFGVYGDPALISNHKGSLFYFHLSDPSGKGNTDEAWLDRIVCQRSDDEGQTWTDGVSIGYNPPKDQDKAWPAVHPKKHFMCVTWTQFDKYGSTDPECQSKIMFSKSLNGTNWSKPTVISQTAGDCLDKDSTAEGAVPVISSDGKIYVAWANRGNIYFDRSYDGGNTWLDNDLVIAKQEGGWNLTIPGIDRSNGLPVLAYDNSEGHFKGTMYMVWADQKNGADNTDIWLIRSRNRGDYWGNPQKINQDTVRAHQFFPWVTVDQTNGNVYILYYDRRDHTDNQTDVYLSYSTDGGNHFKEVKISEDSFTPDAGHFFGDYLNIDAHAGLIAPIWTRMDNGRTSIWTSIIRADELKK
ncbi:MAG: exo-alpha-sialidase [Bacteroidetes bacterium]|nr:exo-alpha-sialidase [Bacteroidota bacterium]MBS1539537.1 exo-alpha-sialidase [Bacteroidota bacterium]